MSGPKHHEGGPHLLDRMIEPLGECPCDFCPVRDECATQRLACKAFSLFVEARPWEGAPREPSRLQFGWIFRQQRMDEAALRALREQKRLTRLARGTRPGRRPRPVVAIAC